MPKIRPIVRGRVPVSRDVGQGLQAIGQAFEDISVLRTNRELLDIRGQAQADRLEQIQFEKVERSEAIRQFTAKQIVRNETAGQILIDAQKARDYGSVQQDMDKWNKSYDQDLFEGRSQEFHDIYESMDRSARVGMINKLATEIQKGNLGIIRDNYQIAADSYVDSVNAASDPAEIVEFFKDLTDYGVGMGMMREVIDAVAGKSLRESMEKLVRSVPIVTGLGLLSDKDVAGALGEDGREILRRDLTVKSNTLRRAQELFNVVHENITGIDIAEALSRGESATSLINKIENDESLSSIQKRDAGDYIIAVSIAREKGPRPVDPETIRTEEQLSLGLMDRHLRELKVVLDPEIKMSDEDREAESRKIINDAIATYQAAVLKEARGEFRSSELTKLKFKMWPIVEGLLKIEEVAKDGFFKRVGEAIGPSLLTILRPELAIIRLFREDVTGADPDEKVPMAIISKEIERMFLGEGRYGGLPPADKASMEIFLVGQSVNTDGSSKLIPREEANVMAQKIFAAVDKEFLLEIKGLTGEAAERTGELIFRSGEPTTEPRRQVDISGVADSIRESLARGWTLDEIEEFMRTQPEFTQEAFDQAAAMVQVVQ